VIIYADENNLETVFYRLFFFYLLSFLADEKKRKKIQKVVDLGCPPDKIIKRIGLVVKK